MGLALGLSSSSYDERPKKVAKNLNPDPKNFKITKARVFGDFLVIKVNYPNCKNYEGNKILVYKNVSLERLFLQGSIDPHFSDNKKMKSPIARFEPTNRGFSMAVRFVQNERLESLKI